MRDGHPFASRVGCSAVSPVTPGPRLLTFGFFTKIGYNVCRLFRLCPEDHLKELVDGMDLLGIGFTECEAVPQARLDDGPVGIREGASIHPVAECVHQLAGEDETVAHF